MELVLLKVNGMSCQHCVNAVNDAVTKLVGVKQVKVDLKEKLNFNYSWTLKLCAFTPVLFVCSVPPSPQRG